MKIKTHVRAGESLPAETVSLNFSTIKWTYTAQKP